MIAMVLLKVCSPQPDVVLLWEDSEAVGIYCTGTLIRLMGSALRKRRRRRSKEKAVEKQAIKKEKYNISCTHVVSMYK